MLVYGAVCRVQFNDSIPNLQTIDSFCIKKFAKLYLILALLSTNTRMNFETCKPSKGVSYIHLSND